MKGVELTIKPLKESEPGDHVSMIDGLKRLKRKAFIMHLEAMAEFLRGSDTRLAMCDS